MYIYVASSWRNDLQPSIVSFLAELGHGVYDFKNPPHKTGFGWQQVPGSPTAVDGVRRWTAGELRTVLEHPISKAGFESDMAGLRGCDVCVLVLPCGRSAHTELGWAAGAGKKTIVFSVTREEPELMYLMCDAIVGSLEELREELAKP